MSRPAQMSLMDATNYLPSWTPDPEGEHGEVFTRQWVVDLILDLVGYVPEADLGEAVIVEPACGGGAFVLPVVERLALSCEEHGRSLADAGLAIRAFDLLERNVEHTRRAVRAKLVELGEPATIARRLAREWIQTGDFLLTGRQAGSADFVVGNPPYIRIEQVPAQIGNMYRSELSTMRGRADIFVGFFEKGLSMLRPEGRLAFICADRWMRNQYGARLRSHVTEDYAVDTIVSMHDVDAFEDSVSAYPAITVLRNGPQGGVRVVDAEAGFDAQASAIVTPWLRGQQHEPAQSDVFKAAELTMWFKGEGLWPTAPPHELELIAELEKRFRPLEDPLTGTRVGIGVASGCDDVYIVTEAHDIEESRLLPLLTSGDIASGNAEWSGQFLVNPWEGGQLVNLADYPGLGAYLEIHAERIRSRHVARKRPSAWYRTIDRVDPGLLARPKLLLPDLKATSHPVLDKGDHYPHHNLYHVISDGWDLEVLGGILLSEFANLFVGAYGVRMRGGTYRFQAQYLRKIRVPDPDELDAGVVNRLRRAFRTRDIAAATHAASVAYGVRLDRAAA